MKITYNVNNNAMPVVDCFFMIAFYLFSLNCGAFLIVMVGIDRFLAIGKPFKSVRHVGKSKIENISRYEHWQPSEYVPLMCLPAIVYGISTVVVGYVSLPNDSASL